MVRLKSVVKRNGEEAPFDGKKIENAIAKAFLATGEVEVRDISTMARAIELIVRTNLKDVARENPTVEQIQDAVELALMKCGYQQTAKAYILYRSQHQKAREKYAAGLQEAGQRLYRGGKRLESEGKFHGHHECRRLDSFQFRRHHSQLLVE